MSRGWVWLQLVVAWLPMWALFSALIMIAHDLPLPDAALGGLRMVVAGAVLGIGVSRFVARTPWPYPFRFGFVAAHVLAAAAYALTWWVLICVIDSFVIGHLAISIGPGIGAFIITGVWLYIMVAGVAYANLAAQRAAKIEAHAARTQLDALRSQLHPHFLFNALHTVVQLIPTDPRAASRAAEMLAAALRTTIQEQRDILSLAEEWAFVERYLAIERIRFGERLRVDAEIPTAALAASLPSFALQTLVENALRHGAAPRIEATQVTISAALTNATLTLKVSDDGGGASAQEIEHGSGSGLRRLRERMRWLYGDRAQLQLISEPGAGFAATLIVPQDGNDQRD